MILPEKGDQNVEQKGWQHFYSITVLYHRFVSASLSISPTGKKKTTTTQPSKEES